jgi:hypothetical protein
MNVAEHERHTSHDDTGVGGNTRPELGGLLCDGAGDGGALHFTLGVDDLCRSANPVLAYVLASSTHHTSVILEVQEDTVCSPPWLALSDNDGGHDLLPQLRLSLLDCGHDHVASTTSRQTVETRTDTLHGDDVQVAGARVVAAVHDGTAKLPLAKPSYLMTLPYRRSIGRIGRVWRRRTLEDRASSSACYRRTNLDCARVSHVSTTSTANSSRFGFTYPRLDAIATGYVGDVVVGGFGVRRRWSCRGREVRQAQNHRGCGAALAEADHARLNWMLVRKLLHHQPSTSTPSHQTPASSLHRTNHYLSLTGHGPWRVTNVAGGPRLYSIYTSVDLAFTRVAIQSDFAQPHHGIQHCAC